jgi:hypothetical protein
VKWHAHSYRPPSPLKAPLVWAPGRPSFGRVQPVPPPSLLIDGLLRWVSTRRWSGANGGCFLGTGLHSAFLNAVAVKRINAGRVRLPCCRPVDSVQAWLAGKSEANSDQHQTNGSRGRPQRRRPHEAPGVVASTKVVHVQGRVSPARRAIRCSSIRSDRERTITRATQGRRPLEERSRRSAGVYRVCQADLAPNPVEQPAGGPTRRSAVAPTSSAFPRPACRGPPRRGRAGRTAPRRAGSQRDVGMDVLSTSEPTRLTDRTGQDPSGIDRLTHRVDNHTTRRTPRPWT